jgi:hypothetical protein
VEKRLNRIRRSLDRIGRRDAPAKAGGHGDHWGCILRAAEHDELLEFIGRIVGEAEQPEMFEAAGAGMAVHAPGDRLSACVLVVNDRVATAYPEALDGPAWPVEISEVVPWANGIEGQITGTCHGAAISFFDTRFYANRRRYRVGQTYDFHVSAFAYRLGRAEDVEVDVEDVGARVSFRGAHAYMPANIGNETADIDDYWFHSALEGGVSVAELAGKHLGIYPIIIAIPEHFEMALTLFAAGHVLAPGTASITPGEDLEGFLWLQGHLA